MKKSDTEKVDSVEYPIKHFKEPVWAHCYALKIIFNFICLFYILFLLVFIGLETLSLLGYQLLISSVDSI